MPVIVLLRHGISSANTAGILAGRASGVSLTDEGVTALEANLALLPNRRFSRLLHSPLQRCVETATIAEKAVETDFVGVDDAFVELDYGDWTGRELKELGREPLWKTVLKTPSAAQFPGGESIAEAAERAVSRVAEIVAELKSEEESEASGESETTAPPRWAMIVSHGDIIKAIIADALGMPLDDFQRISVAPGSFTIIDCSGSWPVLAAMSVTAAGLAQSNTVGGGGMR